MDVPTTNPEQRLVNLLVALFGTIAGLPVDVDIDCLVVHLRCEELVLDKCSLGSISQRLPCEDCPLINLAAHRMLTGLLGFVVSSWGNDDARVVAFG